MQGRTAATASRGQDTQASCHPCISNAICSRHGLCSSKVSLQSADCRGTVTGSTVAQEAMLHGLLYGAVFMTSMAVHNRHTCPAVCAIGWSGKRQECAGSLAYTSIRSVFITAVHVSSICHLPRPVSRSLAVKSWLIMHLLSCSLECSLLAHTGNVCCRDLSILKFMRVC